ncbi:hypothetical protein [Ralstonia solanacearum]|nr:hypothetical protein [Ralstonia solanacearum]
MLSTGFGADEDNAPPSALGCSAAVAVLTDASPGCEVTRRRCASG